MIYVQYAALAALVVFLSFRLSFYVDEIDKKTNLSGALIGGVILAAVTSLPELFTSLTAVLRLNQPNLVQGNILGSNIFNLFILGFLTFLTAKQFQTAKISKSHGNNLLYGIFMYVLVFGALLIPKLSLNLFGFNINIVSIGIVVLYAISIRFMSVDQSATNEEESNSNLTIKQVAVRFGLYALGLVIVSIVLTNVTDQIAKELNLGATVAGALFLGIATSLPEFSSCISLVKMKNYNAAIGNIVGSNIFNFAIFAFADLLHRNGNIFVQDAQATTLAFFGALASIVAIGLIQTREKRWMVRLMSALIIILYLTSIAVGL
ncbi:MAG: sodium:calcium antiporter [Erysipelotrichaceae bacterium]